ncbi:MAG TPA: YraN family protein [bacterium]|jgi:putative endonuclease|nr:YraN family protein [Dictyoglomota bacterium]HOP55832.1 YraN family protein [bacterium]HPC77260.1 YraN family protein [bacterium]HPO82290.1 YraN family protein [bacterium]
MKNKRALGNLGEKKALEYLKNLGYDILAVNFYSQRGEIDIIAEDKGTLSFVEVKTRTGKKFGDPEESITLKKRERIVRTALYYLHSRGWPRLSCRFDVLTVKIDPKTGDTEFNLTRDAFQLEGDTYRYVG